MLHENPISTRSPFLKFSNNQFDLCFIGGFQKKRCIDIWWYEISVGNIITIYFRGKRLSNIRKIVIESLGNPNWVSLCLIIWSKESIAQILMICRPERINQHRFVQNPLQIYPHCRDTGQKMKIAQIGPHLIDEIIPCDLMIISPIRYGSICAIFIRSMDDDCGTVSVLLILHAIQRQILHIIWWMPHFSESWYFLIKQRYTYEPLCINVYAQKYDSEDQNLQRAVTSGLWSSIPTVIVVGICNAPLSLCWRSCPGNRPFWSQVLHSCHIIWKTIISWCRYIANLISKLSIDQNNSRVPVSPEITPHMAILYGW